MITRVTFSLLVCLVLRLGVPPIIHARSLYLSSDGTLSVRLTGYLKTLALGQDPSLPDAPETATDFSRGRVMLEGDVSSWLRWTMHYEHFGVVNPSAEANGGLFTGDRASQIQRPSLLPFDWTVKQNSGFFWRHELDRLNFQFTLSAADIVVGRQAISWGIGRLWTPADMFLGFSPVEIDQEFKRGIDAVRAKIPLGQFSQLEAVYAAFDENFRTHAVGLRGQTSVQNYDVGMMIGKFRHDFVIGPFFDGEVKGAGIRGEFTYTRNTAGRHQERRAFFRAVGNIDYRFANGVYGLLEYYYNGFGETEPEEYPRLASSERLSRGEIFNLGRYYLGVAFEYEFHPLVHGTFFGQWNIMDESGLIGPAIQVSLSDEADLRLGMYFPFGAEFVSPRIQSEFGLYPRLYYLQLRWYF